MSLTACCWEDRETNTSRSPSSAACPGATFTGGFPPLGTLLFLLLDHLLHTGCGWAHRTLPLPHLCSSLSASLLLPLCTSAPLDGQGDRGEHKTKGRRKTKGSEKVRGPRLPKEISRRVSLNIFVPATTAAVGSPAPCSL